MASIELLSPAGSLEKLKVAYDYGADAAYMGLREFSLRANAENFSDNELEEVKRLKKEKGKKLYGALNIIFKESQLDRLYEMKEDIAKWPFDAFIISDIGLVPFLKKNFPERELHLSTQASCINSESARMYYSLGFKRVILGREASLDDIKRIKDRVPELELEAFAHGAMCMSYSGRCLLSQFLTKRSANQGDCSHTCRWKYRLGYYLEEEEREGEHFPIEEYGDYTTILSSKDLNMVNHIEELERAGLSSLKIEGRMKSIFYVATITRAYRKAIDRDKDMDKYIDAIEDVSHREFTTAFFFPEERAESSNITDKGYDGRRKFLGSIKGEIEPGIFEVDIKNQIKSDDKIDAIGPEVPYLQIKDFRLLNESLEETEKLDHGKKGFIKSRTKLKKGYILTKIAHR